MPTRARLDEFIAVVESGDTVGRHRALQHFPVILDHSVIQYDREAL